MSVVDGPVVRQALTDTGPTAEAARALLAGSGPVALPDAALLEVVGALRPALLDGTLPPAAFLEAVDRLRALPLLRAPAAGLLGRVAGLAPWLAPEPAACAALAEALGDELVTLRPLPVPAGVLGCPTRILGGR